MNVTNKRWTISMVAVLLISFIAGKEYQVWDDNKSFHDYFSSGTLGGSQNITGISGNTFDYGSLKVVDANQSIDTKDHLASFNGMIENHSHKTVRILAETVIVGGTVMFYNDKPFVLEPETAQPFVSMETDNFDPNSTDITRGNFVLTYDTN